MWFHWIEYSWCWCQCVKDRLKWQTWKRDDDEHMRSKRSIDGTKCKRRRRRRKGKKNTLWTISHTKVCIEWIVWIIEALNIFTFILRLSFVCVPNFKAHMRSFSIGAPTIFRWWCECQRRHIEFDLAKTLAFIFVYYLAKTQLT